MQPTINSSTYYLGNEDEEHCDIVYYKKTKNYNNNDIVIVNNNSYVSDNEVKYLIKRLVALPNQIIKFELIETETISTLYDDVKYFYSISVYDENNNNLNLDQSYLDGTERMFTTKRLIYACKEMYPFYYEVFSSLAENGEYLYSVPDDSYFVIGDNRNHSTDSRYFGAVKFNDIEGSVRLIVAYNQTLFKAVIIKIKSYL